ncbi:MAG: VanZ family protein [Bacteroidales bacterium]|nr:VanZ family protein [Bacteroidales bacterium]
MTPSRPTTPFYALAVAGAAGFIIYGSLAPFDFRHRNWSEAVDAFLWAMQNRAWPSSRSDWIANVMLGVPLGFSLLGLLRAERYGTIGTIGMALVLWPLCVLLALGVEFGQIFIPERTTSGSDVLAQGLGAAVGMLGWWETGPRWNRLINAWQTNPDTNNLTSRLFVCYLLLLGLLHYLPLDLTLSPGRIARKAYYDVHYVPFSEFVGFTDKQGWQQIQNWIGLCVLFVPLGLLGSRLIPHKHPYRFIGILFLVIPFLLEAGQMFVMSRLPTAAGYLVAVLGIATGGILVQFCKWTSTQSVSAIGLCMWFPAMVIMMWAPFHFETTMSYSVETILPIGEVRFSDPIAMFCQSMTRMITYSLLGCAVAILIGHTSKAGWTGGAIGLVVGTGFEIVQLFLPARTPGTTDILLAAMGTAIGTSITNRLLSDRQERQA